MDYLKDITDFIFVSDIDAYGYVRPDWSGSGAAGGGGAVLDAYAADAIIVPGNRYLQPSIKAAQLYHQGLAPFIVVSGRYEKVKGRFLGPIIEDVIQENATPEKVISDEKDKNPCSPTGGVKAINLAKMQAFLEDKTFPTEADCMAAVLRLYGVPDEVIFKDTEAEFTLENAVNARRILTERGIPQNRLIVVCQAFHARRCKMYFEYVYRDRDVKVMICPVKTQGIDRDNWQESKKGLELVLGEVRRCGEQFSWMLL